MELRVLMLKSILNYYRFSLKWSNAPEIQFLLALKFLKYHSMRHRFHVNTNNHVKNVISGHWLFEYLYNEYLLTRGIDFEAREGWDIGPSKTRLAYLFDCEQLNHLHFQSD